jgi:hypothetical protein
VKTELTLLHAAPATRSGIGMAGWVQIGLFVPFITAFVAWANQQGIFPLRPAIFIAGMTMLCLVLTLMRRPAFPFTVLCILALLLIRVFDAWSQRFEHFLGWQEVTFSMGSSFLLACASAVTCGCLVRGERRPLLWISALSVIICTGANIAETLGILRSSTVEGRTAGFIGDSNDSGIAIVCSLGIFLTLSRKFRHDVMMLAVAAAGIVPTLSRSGLLVYALVAVTWAALNLRAHFTRIMLSSAALIVAALTAVSFIAGSTQDKNVRDRISAIFGGDVDKMASNERLKDLTDGVHAAMLRPVTGHGTGAGFGGWKPHNQFVSLWLDLGILAAGAYALILLSLLAGALFTRGQGLLCALPVIAFVPFSQMLCDTAAYWLCAFTAAAVTSRRQLYFTLRSPAAPTASPAHGLPA